VFHFVVNVKRFKTVDKIDSSYYISLVSERVGGFVLFGVGSIHSSIDSIYVSDTKNKDDYEIVDKWYKSISMPPSQPLSVDDAGNCVYQNPPLGNH